MTFRNSHLSLSELLREVPRWPPNATSSTADPVLSPASTGKLSRGKRPCSATRSFLTSLEIFPHCTMTANSPICSTERGSSLNVFFSRGELTKELVDHPNSISEHKAEYAAWNRYIPVHRQLCESSLGGAVKVLDGSFGRFAVKVDLSPSVHGHEYLRLP